MVGVVFPDIMEIIFAIARISLRYLRNVCQTKQNLVYKIEIYL